MIEWRWYYHVPGMAIWILVFALLVLVRENRDWRAWTILIPAILLTTVLWPLINYLPPSALSGFCFVSAGEQANFAFNSLIGAWTALWLMAPWLARRSVPLAFALALVFLLLSGTIAYVIAFGDNPFWDSSKMLWLRCMSTAIVWYITCAMAMLFGMTLGAIRCRGVYSRRRLLAWLMVGMLAAAVVGTVVYLGQIYRAASRDIPVLLLLLGGLIGSLGVALFTYLVNLPFLYLAHRCPFYRSRLKEVLRLH